MRLLLLRRRGGGSRAPRILGLVLDDARSHRCSCRCAGTSLGSQRRQRIGSRKTCLLGAGGSAIDPVIISTLVSKRGGERIVAARLRDERGDDDRVDRRAAGP